MRSKDITAAYGYIVAMTSGHDGTIYIATASRIFTLHGGNLAELEFLPTDKVKRDTQELLGRPI